MRRSSAWLPAVVAVLVCAAALVGVRLATAEERVTRAELLAYEAAIHPPLFDGGRIVQEQIKPAIAAGGATRAEARQWEDALTAVRARFLEVTPPAPLRRAHHLFDRALQDYILVAHEMGDRDRALSLGASADRTYDDASRIIQRERRRLGLGATEKFPDPQ